MSYAICFKCGAEKFVAYAVCPHCGVTPTTTHDLALSMVLSDAYLPKAELANLSRMLRKGRKCSVPEKLLAQAREALQKTNITQVTIRQYANIISVAVEMLLVQLSEAGICDKTADDLITDAEKSELLAYLRHKHGKDSKLEPREITLTRNSVSGKTPDVKVNNRTRILSKTILHKNQFAFLGVTIRDNRRRIVELADEKSLELDHDACQKARSDLTNPRVRLSAEIAWLPGVSPKKASQLLSTLHSDPMSIREETGLPTLAHLNLLAAAFEAVDGNNSPEDVAEFIQEIAYLVEDLSTEQVLRDINEDRSVSGFPEVKGIDQVEAELSERKRYYRNAVKDALNRLPPASLVDAMTAAVDGVTSGGEDHAPELIDELVDSYAVETQGFLQKEAENAQKLIKAVRDSAKSGENVVKPIVDKLEAVARNWDNVAQPIQLSAKARGKDHEPSHEIAYSIRSLAIDLFNEHDMLTQSQRLTGLIQELFAELPEVAEQVEQDSEALAEIFQNRKKLEAQKNEWAREITYHAKIGTLFKETLSISPDGLVWKNQRYPLDAVTRVRWGGVRHSVNGIPTGTTYTLAFGDNRSEAVIELQMEATYSAFIEKLWRAVGIRLLTELFETLKAGNEVRFGEATLRDDGITLVKHKILGSNESIRCFWDHTHIWSTDGAFYIGAKNDKKTYVILSYIHAANVHVLEQAIRMAFKKPGMRKLSDVLQ